MARAGHPWRSPPLASVSANRIFDFIAPTRPSPLPASTVRSSRMQFSSLKCAFTVLALVISPSRANIS
jgi:hypothetical protein